MLWKGVITGLPPVCLGYATIKLEQQLPFQPNVKEFLQAHPWAVIGCLGWTPLATAIFAGLEKKIASLRARDETDKILAAAVINALDNIVGTKLQRFTGYLKSLSPDLDKATVFETITQPKSQIKTILENLYHVTRQVTGDETVEVLLVAIRNNEPCEWEEVIPRNLQPSPSLLTKQAGLTLFAHCARQKRMVVIQDIESHVRRKKPYYVASGDPETDKGSICCVPVVHEVTGDVIYVLSIKSFQPKQIDEEFKKRFKPVIEVFVTRIRLEHTLIEIKKRACNGQANN